IAADRPAGQSRGVVAATFGCARLRGVWASRIAPGAHAAAAAPARIGAVVSVGAIVSVRTVNAVVDVVIGVGPEVVIGVRPEHVVEGIVIGVGPEQRPDPAGDEPSPPPRPSRAADPAVKA